MKKIRNRVFIIFVILCISFDRTATSEKFLQTFPASMQSTAKDLCNETLQPLVVEDFFNTVFAEFPITTPSCVCIQPCEGHSTFCYPNGCFRKIKGYIKNRKGTFSEMMAEDTILDEQALTTTRQNIPEIREIQEDLKEYYDTSLFYSGMKRFSGFKKLFSQRPGSSFASPLKDRLQLMSFLNYKKPLLFHIEEEKIYEDETTEHEKIKIPKKIEDFKAIDITQTQWPKSDKSAIESETLTQNIVTNTSSNKKTEKDHKLKNNIRKFELKKVTHKPAQLIEPQTEKKDCSPGNGQCEEISGNKEALDNYQMTDAHEEVLERNENEFVTENLNIIPKEDSSLDYMTAYSDTDVRVNMTEKTNTNQHFIGAIRRPSKFNKNIKKIGDQTETEEALEPFRSQNEKSTISNIEIVEVVPKKDYPDYIEITITTSAPQMPQQISLFDLNQSNYRRNRLNKQNKGTNRFDRRRHRPNHKNRFHKKTHVLPDEISEIRKRKRFNRNDPSPRIYIRDLEIINQSLREKMRKKKSQELMSPEISDYGTV